MQCWLSLAAVDTVIGSLIPLNPAATPPKREIHRLPNGSSNRSSWHVLALDELYHCSRGFQGPVLSEI